MQELSLQFRCDRYANGMVVYRVNLPPNRRIEITPSEDHNGWIAYIRSKKKEGILIFHKYTLCASGQSPIVALQKLLKIPCQTYKNKFKSLSQIYKVTYKLPKVRPQPPSSKVQATNWNEAFLYSHRHQNQHMTNTELINQLPLIGQCRHGIYEEECPQCASWGSNWSGVREHD